MSLRPLKFCRSRGCLKTHRLSGSYCLEHKKKQGYKLVSKERLKEDNTTAWKKYSKRLREERIVCVNFRTCAGKADLVDHIVPVEGGGGFWDTTNHQVMCHRCHNRKRQREGGESRRLREAMAIDELNKSKEKN